MSRASVVIPTHGRPESLGRLLDSLGSRHDVVVVDDGSAPGTYDEVSSRFPTVRFEHVAHAGPAAARNHGWRVATGDVVVFVDDDVVAAPETVDRLTGALDGATGPLDAVGARIEPLVPGRLVADFMHAEHLVDHKVVDGDVRWLVSACVAVRRCALEAVGGFDDGLRTAAGEDADLSMRLRRAGFRLAVADVAVRHDHRAGFVQLVRTYYRHGTAQRRLAARNPERLGDLGTSTRTRVSPAAWWATYRGYRAGHGRATSVAFVVLRAAMMLPWLVGALTGARA